MEVFHISSHKNASRVLGNKIDGKLCAETPTQNPEHIQRSLNCAHLHHTTSLPLPKEAAIHSFSLQPTKSGLLNLLHGHLSYLGARYKKAFIIISDHAIRRKLQCQPSEACVSTANGS